MSTRSAFLLAGFFGAWLTAPSAVTTGPADGARPVLAAAVVVDTGRKKPPKKPGEANRDRKPKATGEPRLERRKPPAVPARRRDTTKADPPRLAGIH